MDDFANRLKNTRLALGLSQKQFGALGGVSDSAQGYYENTDPKKQREPSINYLLQLKENEVDIYYLLTGEKVQSDLNAEESLLLETFRNSNDQSKKLILDLCRTLSGLPEQKNKKDDQDPPKSGNTNKMQIKAGGDVGDVMQDSVKNTTHNNYITNSSKNDHKLRFMYEDACEKINNQEKIAKGFTNLVIGFALLYGMGEMIALDLSPRNEIEQIIELILVTAFPLFFAYSVYRSATKKITTYFHNKRKRTEREIYLN